MKLFCAQGAYRRYERIRWWGFTAKKIHSYCDRSFL